MPSLKLTIKANTLDFEDFEVNADAVKIVEIFATASGTPEAADELKIRELAASLRQENAETARVVGESSLASA